MEPQVAVIGAGVSGLTSAILLAERGYPITILARETGNQTTSAAAGAIWYPYDVEPLDAALRWALKSYHTFQTLCSNQDSGVSMMELRTFCRTGTVSIPSWAAALGASLIEIADRGLVASSHPQRAKMFAGGFTLEVPLIDTTIYLNYLADRFRGAGGKFGPHAHLENLAEIDSKFSLIVNCAGIGARSLVGDEDLEPHRGQVVIVPKLKLDSASVCDDAPLMYVIPRTNDCLFGGTNDVSDSRDPDSKTTQAILTECSRVLGIAPPRVVAERVGLRPFRKSGIRLERDQLGGRTVIHNYGHGGAGFTLSWGCAEEVVKMALA
ncbi:MAG: FAD-dependent oxidoreductase [Chthoniobacterales bacterium]